jgi:small GTP-binding protein
LIGDGGIGKTKFYERILKGDSIGYRFSNGYNYTEEYNLGSFMINVNGTNVQVNLWDTAGQENKGVFRDCYLEGADGVIVMYDVTERKTHAHVPKWLANIQLISKETQKKLPFVFVCGNKMDLEKKFGQSKCYTYRDTHLKGLYDPKKMFSGKMSVKSEEGMHEPLKRLLSSILDVDESDIEI